MHVVAERAAIWRGVVGAIQLKRLAALCGVQKTRDEVRLRSVAFADPLSAPRNIEVAQGNGTQLTGLCE